MGVVFSETLFRCTGLWGMLTSKKFGKLFGVGPTEPLGLLWVQRPLARLDVIVKGPFRVTADGFRG